MARSMGPRSGYGPGWVKNFTPGGMVYWTRANDPGWGYLDDPSKTGLQPDATRRYPVEYINYVWAGNASNDPRNSNETRAGQQMRELTASALQGRIAVPYGRVRIGGNIIAWRGNASTLYVTEAVCHGPIHQFVGIRILEQDASLVAGAPFYGDATFQTQLGLAAGTAPPSIYLAATSAQAVERHPYLAVAHGQYNLAGIRGIREAPLPLFTIDGRTLRDPRLGVDVDGIPNQPEAFSKNPALVLADYHTSTIYGPGVPDDRINWESVADTADYCDTLIAGLPRHTINGAILRESSHRAILETIKAIGRISVIRRDGKRVFVPEKIATRVHVFTPSNSQPVEVEKVSMAGKPNIVKVSFTNPSKDYADDSVTAKTEAARTSAEPPAPEEFAFEWIDNASEAQRMADWLLADLRNPLLAHWMGTKAESFQFEPMDVVGYYSPTAHLGVSAADPQDLRIVKVQKRGADGQVRFTGKLYSDDYFTENTRTTETPPVNTTPPPTEAPSAPTSPAGAGSLTVGDGLSAQSTSGLISVTWTHPGWPYTLRYRVTAQTAGGAETAVDDVSSGPVSIDGRTLPVTIRVYAYIPSTGVVSAALTGTQYATTTVPEVTSLYVDMAADNPAVLYFSPPYDRAETLFGAAFWSNGAGLTGFDALRVNNGGTTTVAFTNALSTKPTVQWSDTAATGPWTSPSPQNHVTQIGDGTAYLFRQWSATGHRWWSLSWNSGAERLVFDAGVGLTRAFREYKIYRNGSDQVTEVQLVEYGAEVTGIAGYRLYQQTYDWVGLAFTENGLAIPQIPANSRPTSANPLVVERFGLRTTGDWATSGLESLNLRLTVVLADGTESAGVVHHYNADAGAAGGAADYVPQTQTAMTLANGVNSDIATSAGPGAQEIVGPSAAFTLGGFIAPSDGVWMPISYAGAQICTIANAHASSAAANRIKTFTGGSVVSRGAFEALLRYDTTEALWHLVAFNDGTLRYGNSKVGLGRTPTAAALEVASAGAGLVPLYLYAGGQQYNGILVRNSADTEWNGFLYDSTNKWVIVSANETGAAVILSTGGSERARVMSTGLRLGASGAEVSQFLSGSKTWDPPSVAASSFTSTTVTVTGAAAGDKVLASFSTITDPAMVVIGRVSAASTVEVTLANSDPSNAYNLASGTLSVLVIKHT